MSLEPSLPRHNNWQKAPEMPKEIAARAHNAIQAVAEGQEISADQRASIGAAAVLFEDPMTRSLPKPQFTWGFAAFELSQIAASSEGYPRNGEGQEKYDYFRGFEGAIKNASLGIKGGADELVRLQTAGGFLNQLSQI